MEDFGSVEELCVGSRDGMNHCPGFELVYLVGRLFICHSEVLLDQHSI